MDFNAPALGIFVRIIAIVSLLLGLNDAARLLGVNAGAISPLTTLGTAGFVYLAVFCLARLFAAVGLWIRASWGGVLLAGATAIELALYLSGNPDVQMTAFGFGLRLVLVVSILVIFFLRVRHRRARATD
ncbi:MAG TPA: hypothetical protein VN155_01405 [Devosia sp.]|nr:hypothetical protein [Devosia sp.]